jgi:hypothetical protein
MDEVNKYSILPDLSDNKILNKRVSSETPDFYLNYFLPEACLFSFCWIDIFFQLHKDKAEGHQKAQL